MEQFGQCQVESMAALLMIVVVKLLRNSKVQENVMMNQASKAIADSRLLLLCRQCFNLTFVMSAGTQDSKYKSDIMILSSVCL